MADHWGKPWFWCRHKGADIKRRVHQSSDDTKISFYSVRQCSMMNDCCVIFVLSTLFFPSRPNTVLADFFFKWSQPWRTLTLKSSKSSSSPWMSASTFASPLCWCSSRTSTWRLTVWKTTKEDCVSVAHSETNDRVRPHTLSFSCWIYLQSCLTCLQTWSVWLPNGWAL